MPIYSSLETIKEGFSSTHEEYTQWKVFDQDDNLMNVFKGLASTTPSDAYMNLEKFLENMTGEGYVIIKAYPRKMTLGKGGDTAQVLKFNYRLKAEKATSSGSSGSGGISLEMYLAQMQQVSELRTQLAIQSITDKLTKKETKDTSYFERVAESMGKSFAKEYLRKEGIHDEDEDGNPLPIKKKKAGGIGEKPAAEPKPEDKEKIKTAFQRTGNATVRIMKISKQLGSDYDAVAESFEDIANLAESNPLKLKAIFDKLKEDE